MNLHDGIVLLKQAHNKLFANIHAMHVFDKDKDIDKYFSHGGSSAADSRPDYLLQARQDNAHRAHSGSNESTISEEEQIEIEKVAHVHDEEKKVWRRRDAILLATIFGAIVVYGTVANYIGSHLLGT